MIGYRDTASDRPHSLRLDGVLITFAAGGVCWCPAAEQGQALVRTGMRRSRFTRVERKEKTERPSRRSKRQADKAPVAATAEAAPALSPTPDPPLESDTPSSEAAPATGEAES